MSGESQHQFAWGSLGVLQQKGEPCQEHAFASPAKCQRFPLRAGTRPTWPQRKGSSPSGNVKPVNTSGRSCCFLPDPTEIPVVSQVSSSAQLCSQGMGETCTPWGFPVLDSLCLGLSGEGTDTRLSEETQLPGTHRTRFARDSFAVSFHCFPSS